MIDYYLKFLSREWAFAALKDAGYTSVNEQGSEFIVLASHNYCIDEIGIIYKGGKWEFNEQGEMIVIEQPVQVDGWHVNIRILSGDIAENLKYFVIDNPKTPYRIFG